MKILVTGATVFLGGAVIKELNKLFDSSQIVGSGRNTKRINELEKEGIRIFAGDLNSPGYIKDNFEDITHVVHCAARTSTWGTYDEFYSANVTATKNLLWNIPDLARFVYISSPGIYFNYTDR